MDTTGNNQNIINKLLIFLALIPMSIYAYYVLHFSINVPRQDDYDAVLGFLINYSKASFPEKMMSLFSQQNEHRILLSRIVYAIYYTLTGGINFRHIILLNLALLITLFTTIAWFIRKVIPAHWQVAVIMLSFAMFDLNNFENADFAMAGLQNYGVILLFMGSIFFYNKDGNKYLVPAILLQATCVFSSGNGNIGAFFILLFALLSKSRPKIIAALITFCLVSPLYYVSYMQPATNFFTLDPAKFLPFFLHAIAAHFSNEGGVVIGVALLVILFATLPVGKRFVIRNNSLPLLCLAGFILASLGVMSLFRGNMDIFVSYSSRYFIYSHILVTVLFVFAIIRLQEKGTMLKALQIGMMVLTIIIYKKNADYGLGGMDWQYNCRKTREFDYPFPEKAKQIADESCQLGIYCIGEHRDE